MKCMGGGRQRTVEDFERWAVEDDVNSRGREEKN